MGRLKTVYFYWTCPDFNAWVWFADLLVDIEHMCYDNGYPEFLSINIFATRGWNEEQGVCPTPLCPALARQLPRLLSTYITPLSPPTTCSAMAAMYGSDVSLSSPPPSHLAVI
jgi:hypothetical protein